MRISALAGLFAILAIVAVNANSPTANAETLDLTKIESKNTIVALVNEQKEEDKRNEENQNQPEVEPKVTHTVTTGDNLSKIAQVYNTTWKRVYDKNTSIQDPDVISAGQVIEIPKPDEVLEERQVPVDYVAPVETTRQTTTPQRNSEQSTVVTTGGMASAAGNRYTPGYCTFYAKNRRADLPNNLGNANTWVSRAAAQGIPTGSSPRVGAIGQQGMHVVYVESVNGDGSVTVSEMNFVGYNVVSSRTVPASTFMYIY